MNFKSKGEESCLCITRTGLVSGVTYPFEACIDNIIEFISMLFSSKFYHAIPSIIIIVSVWLLFSHKTSKSIHRLANGNNKLKIAFKILIATPIIQISLFSWLRSQEFLYCILSRVTSASIFSEANKQNEHKFYLNSLFFNRKSTESRPFTELLCCSTAICIASYILFLTVNELKYRNTTLQKPLTRIEPEDEPDDGISVIMDKSDRRLTGRPSKANKYPKSSQDDGNQNSNDEGRILTRAQRRTNSLLPDVITTDKETN